MQYFSLLDAYNRKIHSLRLSVTDRCNLRCQYCFTEEPIFMPEDTLLSYKELLTLLHICSELSIHKVRITGGEPFVRHGLLSFLRTIKEELPHIDLRITTNGILLEQHLQELYDIGIRHLNISLDSFNPTTFKQITKRDLFSTVYRAICKSIEYGFIVKINVVAMKGVNDSELDDFIDFAKANPVCIRFIEYMPIGFTTALDASILWSTDDILSEIQKRVTLEPQISINDSGPARVYAIQGGKGSIGVISPLSNHFCYTCDRLRITADGTVKTCLYSTDDISLRDALRSSQPKERIQHILRNAIVTKPRGIELFEQRNGNVLAGRTMNAIGG